MLPAPTTCKIIKPIKQAQAFLGNLQLFTINVFKTITNESNKHKHGNIGNGSCLTLARCQMLSFMQNAENQNMSKIIFGTLRLKEVLLVLFFFIIPIKVLTVLGVIMYLKCFHFFLTGREKEREKEEKEKGRGRQISSVGT